MTISSNLAGLMINAASLALARKLIFVSIDIYFMFDRKLLSKLSQCVWPPARRPTARRESAERVFNIPADESSDGTAKVVYQIPSADDPSSGLFIGHTSPPSSLFLRRDRLSNRSRSFDLVI